MSQITVLAVVLGIAIAFPLALIARRYPRLESTILGVSTGIYTIPSLALFPLLVPFTGLSRTTVVIGLALYALTILVRAVLEGLRSVPDDVRESATGLGYGPTRLLVRIELPLAIPVIMAGLRVATVSTVALTTVGSLVAYGGLGQPDQGRRQHQLPRRADDRRHPVRRAGDRARPRDRDRATADHAVDPGCAGMTVFRDTWDYLTTGANWTGDAGMLHLLVQQLLLTVHGAGPGPGHRPADRAVAGSPRPWRTARDQRLERRPRRPDLRPAGTLRHRRLPGHSGVRTLRTGRWRRSSRWRCSRCRRSSPTPTSPCARCRPSASRRPTAWG